MVGLADLGQYIMTSPQAQAGLAMMRGEDPAMGLQRANAALTMEAQAEERERQKKTRAALASALNGGGGFSEQLGVDLMKSGDIETGLKIIDAARKQQALKQKQALMEQIAGGGMGGEGGDAMSIAALAATSGDSSLMGLAQMMQQNARDVRSEQRELDKEKRKAPTESQANAAGYANRMIESEAILTPLEDQGISTADSGQKALSKLPLVGNFLTSDDFQSYNQAAEDWVRAKLRKESGAVIADEEMEREIKTYFPRPGDSKKVIEQKRLARQTAVGGISAGAKPGSVNPPKAKSPSEQEQLDYLLSLPEDEFNAIAGQ